MEQVEKLKARERMLATQNNDSAKTAATQNFAEQGESAAIVASETGFGNKETYRQAKFVADHAGRKSFSVERFHHQYCMIYQQNRYFFSLHGWPISPKFD